MNLSGIGNIHQFASQAGKNIEATMKTITRKIEKGLNLNSQEIKTLKDVVDKSDLPAQEKAHLKDNPEVAVRHRIWTGGRPGPWVS